MDIILSFLAKPVDKHGITSVHITYLPLNQYTGWFLKITVIRAPTMIIFMKSLRVFEIQDTLFQRLGLITILRALSGIKVQFSHSP